MTLSQRRGAVAAGAMLIAVVTGFAAHPQDGSQNPQAAASASHASQQAIAIGAVVPRESMHLVTRPGAYGLSNPPEGNGYAIVSGHLVRIDSASGKILSALRRVERILD